MGKCEQASKASIIELGTCNIFKSLTMNILAVQGYSRAIVGRGFKLLLGLSIKKCEQVSSLSCTVTSYIRTKSEAKHLPSQ
jgi:hypothetical protein